MTTAQVPPTVEEEGVGEDSCMSPINSMWSILMAFVQCRVLINGELKRSSSRGSLTLSSRLSIISNTLFAYP